MYVQLILVHHPIIEVTHNRSFSIYSTIARIDTFDKVSIEIRNSSNKWKTIPVESMTGFDYKADVPADIVTPGIINYRIMVKKANGDTYTFPGGFKGDPFAWDEYRNES